MRHILILQFALFLSCFTYAQIQVTINLATDSGVKKTEYLNFSIAKEKEVIHDFHYDKFSKTGWYSNYDLYQLSGPVDIGNYKLNVILKKEKEESISETLSIDATIERVEIFILVSTNDSLGDYVKELKFLSFKKNADCIIFSFIDTPTIGSKAAFNLRNRSGKILMGYPNNAFFFGTLYENIKDDSWTQHYPLDLNYLYCDTISKPKILLPGQQVKAWTPNEKDCSEYLFTKKGKYFFQLLYSEQEFKGETIQGLTNIKKAKVYRQIFRFSI